MPSGYKKEVLESSSLHFHNIIITSNRKEKLVTSSSNSGIINTKYNAIHTQSDNFIIDISKKMKGKQNNDRIIITCW